MDELWTASYIALWIVVGVLAFIVMGLLRQLGILQMRLGVEPGVLITREGLPRGAAAPGFEAADLLSGTPLRLADFRGSRVALIFLTPTCDACRGLVPHLNDVAREWREVRFLAVCYAAEEACGELVRSAGVQIPMIGDPGNAVGMSYEVPSTPFAFLIDEGGTILIRGVVNTWPQLEALLAERGTLRSGASAEEVGIHTSRHVVSGGDGHGVLLGGGVIGATAPRDGAETGSRNGK